MRETPSSASREFGGTPSMTMTLDGQRDTLAYPADLHLIHQAGNEEARCPRGRICPASVESFGDGCCVNAVFEKHVRAGVDEKIDALLLRRFANGRDALHLPVDAVKTRALDDPIFEVDANHAQFQKARYVRGQLAVVFTIDPQ